MIWKTSSRKQSEHGRHGHWCESGCDSQSECDYEGQMPGVTGAAALSEPMDKCHFNPCSLPDSEVPLRLISSIY